MLNRRHIREKVMKALYAFFQSDNTQVTSGEKELFHSIDKVYEIYLYYLAFAPALQHFSTNLIEEKKLKRLPTHEDLNPKTNFINNKIISLISENADFSHKISRSKISWDAEQDLIKRIYNQFKDSKEFRKYLEIPEPGFEDDKEIIIQLYELYIFPSDDIRQLFEERSIYWLDDVELMQTGILKTFKLMKEDQPGFKLLPLHKEAEEDRQFAADLFRKTIANSEEFEKEIAGRTQNWEIERVAKMDIILMKMAICELTLFPSIPVKVTLDEYIEISKDYSSPQSKTFINGILDKMVMDYKRDKKIQKVGRGLME